MTGYLIQELESVDSTNNYAMAKVHAGLAKHGAAWFAHRQFAGKGQRGKGWDSAPGMNVILSLVVEPSLFPPLTPFLLTQLFSNCIAGIWDGFTNGETSIKWPNDIYWRDRKAGGILIENVFRGDAWLFAVCGIGLNINQTEFAATSGRPVSLRQVTGREHDPLAIARSISGSFYNKLNEFEPTDVRREYNERLFAKRMAVQLRRKDELITTIIDHVDENGRLHTTNPNHKFNFGEIEWLIK